MIGRAISASDPSWTVFGIDNFSRAGSVTNREPLQRLGMEVFEIDLRDRDRILALPKADWVIDCAANPSVLAGVDGMTTSQSLMDHNLVGTIHLLEYCKEHQAGLVLLSTSRVYSVEGLSTIPCLSVNDHFEPDLAKPVGSRWHGLTKAGVSEAFSSAPPLSLYGVSKLASEWIAMEYAAAFDFPLWINRCGVMSGAGQFGKPDQGIIAFWLHAYRYRQSLRYIGFNGLGHQVRDALHPADLWDLIRLQIQAKRDSSKPGLANVSGGIESAFSLAQLTQWCANRWKGAVDQDDVQMTSDANPRRFDCPWLVLDSTLVREAWGWQPQICLADILDEVADHAESHPEWLQVSGAI